MGKVLHKISIDIEGTMILENHHFATITINICSGKNQQLMLVSSVKEVNEFHEEQDIYMVSKYLPRLCINHVLITK